MEDFRVIVDRTRGLVASTLKKKAFNLMPYLRDHQNKGRK
jgi:hypothetical protein